MVRGMVASLNRVARRAIRSDRSTPMSTVFTKIIDGELPGRFVWTDERAVGFLSINPLGPGHTLVVPREEVDHWVDARPDLLAHLTARVPRDRRGRAARHLAAAAGGAAGGGLRGAPPARARLPGLATWRTSTSPTPRRSVDAAEQDAHAETLRAALRAAGHGAHVPD